MRAPANQNLSTTKSFFNFHRRPVLLRVMGHGSVKDPAHLFINGSVKPECTYPTISAPKRLFQLVDRLVICQNVSARMQDPSGQHLFAPNFLRVSWYPLVNVYVTMEKHHFQVNPLFRLGHFQQLRSKLPEGRYPVSLDVQRCCTGTISKRCVIPPLWTNQLKCWMNWPKLVPSFWKHPRVMVLSSIMLHHSFCVPVLYVYHTFNHEFCRDTFGKCMVFDEVERLARCLQTSQVVSSHCSIQHSYVLVSLPKKYLKLERLHDNRPRYLMANQQCGPWIPHFQTQPNSISSVIKKSCHNVKS